MQTPRLLLFFFLTFSLLLAGVQGSFHNDEHYFQSHKHRELNKFRPNKLFVFGDSYADIGNGRIFLDKSWKPPYGITFPGKPAGRFSDGRVLTDYVAKLVGVRSLIPYRWRKLGFKYAKNGMNFAVGGTGVFDALSLPNMTTQINFFENLIKRSVYSIRDLQSSFALVTLAGNDYSPYKAKNGSQEGLKEFIPRVVNQLTENLRRIQELGVKKVAVTALQPLGCLPHTTIASSYQHCNFTENELVGLHNHLLRQAVDSLNSGEKGYTFVVLDLYASFMSVLDKRFHFVNPLKPCCMGLSNEFRCGSVNEKGEKQYTVCENPDTAFFWDEDHPTQEGWKAAFNEGIRTTLEGHFGLNASSSSPSLRH